MGRLILDAGQTFGFIGPLDPSLNVVGTNSNEIVYLQSHAKATFDASFNRGGDTLFIDGQASDYSGHIAGSEFVLTDTLGTLVNIPFGRVGLTINFTDDTRILKINDAGNAVVLGDQTFSSETTQLDSTIGQAGFEPQLPVIDSFSLEDTAPSTHLMLAIGEYA